MTRFMTRYLTLGSVVLGFLLLTCMPSMAGEELKQAVNLYQQKQYREASKVLEVYLKQNGNSATAHYYAALCAQQLGQLGSAKYHYQQVVRISPQSKLATYSQSFLSRVGGGSGAVVSSSNASIAKPSGRTVDVEGPKSARVYYVANGDRIMVPVELNGRRVEMLLDTGAPGICIGKNQLAEVGHPSPSGPPIGKVGGSANSEKQNFWVIRADVKIGPMLLRNAKVTVLENNQAAALVGQTFLTYFDYTIDHGDHSIHFKRKGATVAGHASGYQVPFKFRPAGNRIILEAEVNGRKSSFMMDTGNSASGISFNSVRQAADYGAPVPDWARVTSHSGISGSGKCYEYTVDRVRLGPIEQTNVSVSANMETEGGREEPLLGQSMFNGWQTTIDMDKKVLRLLRR